MALPTTRQLHIDYCLRNLGAPVVQVNVAAEQIEDRVDEALQFYRDYHYDGVEKLYLKHQLTSTDIANGYIPLSDAVVGIVSIFPVTDASNPSNIFDLQYQLRLNDLYNLTNTSIMYYNTAMEYVQTIKMLLTGHPQVRFNKNQNRLYLDMELGKDILEGQYVVVECYRALNPTEFADIWKDPFLLKYTTALIKRQWGHNLKKYSGIQLPGGITLDGNALYDEAVNEIKDLEDELINSKSPPLDFFLG